MVRVIADEEDINEYIKYFMTKYPEIKAVVYVDVDDDLEKTVEDYFKNKYKGTVLFFGIYEHGFSIKNSLTYDFPHCQLTVLTRYDKLKPQTLLAARKSTRLILTKILHSIRTDLEETRGAADFDPNPANGYQWTFKLQNDLMLPVGDIANCGCRGWSIDFEMGFPVTEVI